MNTTSEVTQDALAKRLAAADKRIAQLEAALANARREAMEEVAMEARIVASVLSNPSAQDTLRFFADSINAKLAGGKDE